MNEEKKPDDFRDVASQFDSTAEASAVASLPKRKTIVDEVNEKGFYCSFEGDPQALFRLMATARGPSCKRSDDVKGEVIEVEHIYAHMVELANQESGEIVDNVRVVVITTDKQFVAFVSTGVLDSLQMAIDFFGRPPFNPPIKYKVTDSQTRRGRRLTTLVPV